MGSDSESDSRRSSIEEEEGAGGGMQEHDHVMSPKEEMMAHTDYEYTGPKKFIHEKIFSLPPDKWKRGFWDIHVCQTCYKQPGYYFAGCCCTCCFVFYQRKALLGDRMATEYSCCQGAYGKCWCTPCARMCPHLCLLVESFCCTSCGVSGNRKEMMNIYPTQNTWGECCLLWTATILSFFGYFAACITILVNGCLNSQQENEWVKHEKKTGLMPYCSWGDKGAHLCNCPANKCQPCCGDPCSVGDGLYCCLCWTFGCLCSSSKLLAWGADQNCAVVNHFGAYLGAVLFILFGGGLVGALASFFPCILPIVPCAVYFPLATLNGISRHNVRSKAEIGRNQDWFGDCILANLPCTYCCSMCQMCRVVPKESWDWLAQVREHGLTMMETEFKYFPDQEVYVPGRDVEWENQPIPPLLPCLAKEEGEEDEEDEDGEKKEKKKDKKKDKKEKKEVKEESKEVKEDKKDKSASASEASGTESESEKSAASVKSASEKKSGSGSGSGSGSESESAKSAKKSSSSSSDEGSDEGSDSGSDESGSEESD